jgi:hypothetical protein
MTDTLKALLIALITTLPAYYLLWSQRRKNISEGESSSAEAAAKLNAQTIAMNNSLRADMAQQKHDMQTLQDKVFLLEQQLKAERQSTYLYKQYINYLLDGVKQLTGQLQMLKQPAAFQPITLEAFEAAYNA